MEGDKELLPAAELGKVVRENLSTVDDICHSVEQALELVREVPNLPKTIFTLLFLIRNEPLYIQQIKDSGKVAPGSVQLTLDRLTDDGFVTRIADSAPPMDFKGLPRVKFAITESGKTKLRIYLLLGLILSE